jgi:hypothetical protein
MPQGGAFNFDFCFSPIFVSHAKSTDCRRKKDSIPIAIRWGSAVSPHPPQPPAATFKRINQTRAEHPAQFYVSAKRASD